MAFGSADVAKLVVDLSLKGNFVSQLSKVNSSLAKTNAKIDATSSRAYKAGQQIGTGIKSGAVLAAAGVGILVSQVGFGLNSLINLEQVTTQTNAVLKSTGNVAGQTSDSIRAMSEHFESLNATMDDTAIQSGANVLLTFTNIRKKAFEPTLKAALDLSTAMHQDLQTSIVQVGKALNDPITGLTSLQRIGVSFSAQQKDQITGFFKLTKEENKHYAALVKTNKAAAARYLATHNQIATDKAQAIILAELNKEFGGSFLAGGNTTAAKVAKFGDAMEDLQRSLATALLPTVSNVADALNDLLRDPAVIASTEKLGKDIAQIFSKENISQGIAALRSGFGVLKEAAGVIADIVKAAVGAFTSLPEPLQKLLVGGFVANKLTGGLVTNVLGGLVGAIGKSLGIIKAPLVNVSGGVVNVGGGGPGGVAGAAGKGGLSLLGVGTAAALGLAVAAAWKSTVQDPELQKQTAAIDKSTQAQIDSHASLADLLKTQAALDQGISDLTVKTQDGNPVPILNDIFGVLYGGQKQDLQNQRDLIAAAIAAAQAGPGTGMDNTRPHGTGSSQGNMEAHRGEIGNRLSSAEIGHAAAVGVKQGLGPDIESLRGAISQGLTSGKSVDVAKAIQTAAAQRDAETSSSIQSLISQTELVARSTDIEAMRGKIADGLVTTQGAIGQGADRTASAALSAGNEVAGAIRSKDLSINQAISINVNVSAAGVTKSVTIQNRAGPGNGSSGRDGDGGGGPGQ